MARSTFSPLPVADTSVNEVSGRPVISNLLTSLRPGQWTKNLLVFAALVFGRRLFDPTAVAEAIAAFAIFCVLACVALWVLAVVFVVYAPFAPRTARRSSRAPGRQPSWLMPEFTS
jgi:hypothetical protein